MKAPQRHILTWIKGGIWYVALAYFSYLMVLITLQYIPIDFGAAFLRVKVDAIQHLHYQIAFFSHVYTSIFVLVLGATQFSARLRLRYRPLHRTLGMGYVGLILGIAAPSGFVMALYANGGLGSQISFILQAILWWGFTFWAIKTAKDRNWKGHERWMMRSYALTLSAISLRLIKWIIVSTVAWPPMDTYRIVSWAGWLVNLAIVEIWILRTRR
ncbi:DUF2306 domain-containing protein [Pontibacter sp. G13]|uniref:DUF2306 domain-containing protein n=1 Tax=Pontibacter sp. G13 TaxID=3074898 RepID=UPI00288AF66F|nr:DUF2306 domain-containing protein [Pontibacter sp. G13]WNJ17755.1 DUF2306 domain-containing protein [Pontibacter sp. G13]